MTNPSLKFSTQASETQLQSPVQLACSRGFFPVFARQWAAAVLGCLYSSQADQDLSGICKGNCPYTGVPGWTHHHVNGVTELMTFMRFYACSKIQRPYLNPRSADPIRGNNPTPPVRRNYSVIRFNPSISRGIQLERTRGPGCIHFIMLHHLTLNPTTTIQSFQSVNLPIRTPAIRQSG